MTELRIGKGKPGPGRPAGSVNVTKHADRKRFAQRAADEADKCIETLIFIRDKSPSHQARIQACNSILDRAYGKPAQSVTLSDDDETNGAMLQNAFIAFASALGKALGTKMIDVTPQATTTKS